MNKNPYAPPNSSMSAGRMDTLMNGTGHLNLWRISKYAMCLFFVEFACGLMQEFLLTRSGDSQLVMSRFITDVAASLVVSAVFFFALSYRHPHDRWLQSTRVFALYTAVSLPFSWLLGIWMDVSHSAMLLFMDWLVLLLGAVVGTALGAFFVSERVPHGTEP